MKRGAVFLLTVIMSGIAFALAPALSAYEGGVADANRDAGCITPCHEVTSSATINMQASSQNLDSGESVTVTVTVTGGQASNSPLGVMLLSSFGSSGSRPSDTGWTITSDPAGTNFNYNQIDSYAGSATLQWTLNAPTVDGLYTLYARIVHGGGEKYVGDYDGGLAFVVGTSIPPGAPTVLITNPSDEETVSGDLVVTATIASTTQVAYAILSIDGEVVDNKSASPFSWTIDTKTLEDGDHTVNITAVDTSGREGFNQVVMVVNNSSEDEALLNWVYTMAAGAVGIVALISAGIVIVLLIRRRLMSKKEEK